MPESLTIAPNAEPIRIRVLLIEDDPIATRLLKADFQAREAADLELIGVQRLSEGLRLLTEERADVVLLDLFLEDAAGLETLSRVREIAPDIPVVVLTGLDDEAHGLQALKHGAQDYIIKGNVNKHLLFRALRYAIERKQAETARMRLEQRLQQNQKLEAVGTLAGGVAHTFNNILTVILGQANLLLEQTSQNSGERHNLESIRKAAERAAALTRQLLTFSRKRQAAPGLVSLNKIVSGIEMLLESMLSGDVELQLKLAPGIGLVRVDLGQIQQLVMNLVMNARDAMPNGGKITIETARHKPFGGSSDHMELEGAESRDRVFLSVRDTGCGISAEERAHIFEPFFTTKGLAQASGLGLSTVYGIVKQHSATIDVDSRPGHGTKFSIAFPMAGAEPAPDPEVQESRRATVLVIEKGRPPRELDSVDATGSMLITKPQELEAAHGS